MARILAICGSPRKGNTEFALNTVLSEITSHEKELVLLKDKNIKRCGGCLKCDATKKCSINDDMQNLYGKIENADLIILGTPNYYENVSGLMKDFIDRTNPFYETGKLKGKKVFALIIGGGSVINSKRTLKSLKYFIEAHEMILFDSLILKALHSEDLKNNAESIEKLKEFGRKINNL